MFKKFNQLLQGGFRSPLNGIYVQCNATMNFATCFIFIYSTSVRICVRMTLLHPMCILARFNGTIYTERNKCEQKKHRVAYLFRVQVLLLHLFELETITFFLQWMQMLDFVWIKEHQTKYLFWSMIIFQTGHMSAVRVT